MAKREISQQEEIKPVVTGNVKKKEKGFFESFIQEDAKSIATEIRDEIIKPTIRDMIFNGFKAGLEKLLYGESTGSYYHGGYSNYKKAGTTNYQAMYSNYSTPKKASPKSKYDVEPIIFDSMVDVDSVLVNLGELMERYQQISIADYYRLAGVDYERTDYNYGWLSMEGIKPIKAREGWTIDFPRARPLEE